VKNKGGGGRKPEGERGSHLFENWGETQRAPPGKSSYERGKGGGKVSFAPSGHIDSSIRTSN